MQGYFNFIMIMIVMLSILITQGCEDPLSSDSDNNYEKAIQIEVRDSEGYNFLLFMPANDKEILNNKYPLIIFLHGIGERGSDLQLLKEKDSRKFLMATPLFHLW